jgi:hypothetical protein
MKAFWKMLLICASAVCGFCDTVVVPQDRAAQSGNQQWVAGIAIPSGTYTQTIYGAKNFPGAVEITGLAFRPDENATLFGSGSLDVVIPSFEARLTTHPGPPQFLAPRYDDNKGVDDTLVYSGSLHWTLTDLPGNVPNPFSMTISFSNPFIYDPSKGDLLLAFTSSGPSGAGGIPADDQSHGDFSTGSTFEGGFAVADSIVAQFTYQTIPEPTVLFLFLGFGPLVISRIRKK